ncbi:alpha/beta hydrolase [Nocardioides panacis]|uniref:Alpha/beta hydrolase n=1 Tax=Nocardioides panacis TaxID=2849501 RepID=A0A975SVX8_9ACTN|nr:alpha/beta hydrolase [Nocardioides panacis]QWZ06917.1 alpha/beta hydrolase [Nocardioides panacis]
MTKRRWLGLAAAGMGATAAAVTAGFFVERKVDHTRRAGAPGADELGSLHSDALTVRTEDGVSLHAEVDEVAPYSEEAAKTRPVSRVGKPRRRVAPDPTVVFVHGYALNLDCWHFQRAYFRGKHRLVFYDQRSHGRSGRSDKAHATIDQLGDDLRQVIEELVPEGPVVLVGHSMGGMSIMAFAERHRDLFDERVTGVALMSTTAGGLKTHHIVSRLIPDSIGGQVGSRVIAGLARAPQLVDSLRRRGSNIGFLVAEQFAFGGDVPASYVEFVNNMLAATSFQVLAEFFPNFDTLDKYGALGAFAEVPTTILSGTEDVLTSVGHSRKMAQRIGGAKLVECAGAGHMVILEQKDRVNTALDELLAAAAAGPTSQVS